MGVVGHGTRSRTDVEGLGSGRSRRKRAAAAVSLGVLLLVSLSAAAAGQAQQPVTLSVVLNAAWTDTGLYLAQGQSVTVTARGTMNWYTGACNGKCLSTPAGIPCPGRTTMRLGLPCLSLIGKVGVDGKPFEVGASITFTAPVAGEFYLGVNDDYLPDNTGNWTATITSPTAFTKPQGFTYQRRVDAATLGNCTEDHAATTSVEDALSLGRQAFTHNNPKAAGCWWRIGAEKGNLEAQFYMGIWYDYGQGGITDHDEAMRWFQKSAAGGYTTARNYLVCTSPEVEETMKRVFEASGSDPQVRGIGTLLKVIMGMEEHDELVEVTDMKPGDFSSQQKFSCTAMFRAKRKVTTTDEDGKEQAVIPEWFGSMAPIVQTFVIEKSGEKGKYSVTMPYVGSLGAARFALSRPYSKITDAPDW